MNYDYLAQKKTATLMLFVYSLKESVKSKLKLQPDKFSNRLFLWSDRIWEFYLGEELRQKQCSNVDTNVKLRV